MSTQDSLEVSVIQATTQGSNGTQPSGAATFTPLGSATCTKDVTVLTGRSGGGGCIRLADDQAQQVDRSDDDEEDGPARGDVVSDDPVEPNGDQDDSKEASQHRMMQRAGEARENDHGCLPSMGVEWALAR